MDGIKVRYEFHIEDKTCRELPEDYVNCDSIEQLESDLINGAGDMLEWGVSIHKDDLAKLWTAVQAAKAEGSK